MMNCLSRNFVLLLGLSVLFSCNREETSEYITEIAQLKVDSVLVPQDTIAIHSTQMLRTYFTLQQGCEGLYNIDYQSENGLIRNITPYKYKTNIACGSAAAGHSDISFTPKEAGTYTLKFYSGENTWITKNIVVVD